MAELAAIGRPAILVPLPHALDQDQLANANVLAKAGGAIVLRQDDFTPERLADEIAGLAADPGKLPAMAAGAKSAGVLDAADRLADLVFRVAASIERIRRRMAISPVSVMAGLVPAIPIDDARAVPA